MQATFQTRVQLGGHDMAVLNRFAGLYALVEHELFAAYSRTGEVRAMDKLKSTICAKHRITARQFNAVSVFLKGKISSRQEVNKSALAQVREDLKAVRRSLAKLLKCAGPLDATQRRSWAAKKRRLARLEAKELELSTGRVALCFGSRKLFRAQFDLAASGFRDHAEWLSAWRDARSSQFCLVGSKDEASGNQSCTAAVAENGTFSLRLRLPDALIEHPGEKYLMLHNVWFEHGQWELLAALDEKQAISYRFLRDDKGWRVFASTARADYRSKPDLQLGTVGVDINAEHLAVSEVDRFGNLVHRFSVPCVTHGKTARQRQEVVRSAAKAVVGYAAKVGKPLVHEKLDFSRRKQELAGDRRNAQLSRALSSFAYSGFIQSLQSNALLMRVASLEVNPAYTSVIGRVKYAKPLGVSVHQAAAMAIARRGMGFGEAAPRRPVIPDGRGDHLIIELPARNRSMHEWSHWAKVRSKVQGTLAGWHRLRRIAALEAVQVVNAARVASRGQSDAGAVRARPPNRQLHRLAGVRGTNVHGI
ncbi:transposase [Hydrogenophaga sp. BPS33]|uniref:transposase n=1 Tax=Hydrogenophaga sp. BPS33 TaxID=2651974 RepID=UPI00131F6818|nr:transposase [Hydrogenophaga sp. BPS33]QHE87149.1 IS200/IS605 family element transposase accessory protein TnpB [Hydrogenophaga sp. BPS33]